MPPEISYVPIRNDLVMMPKHQPFPISADALHCCPDVASKYVRLNCACAFCTVAFCWINQAGIMVSAHLDLVEIV